MRAHRASGIDADAASRILRADEVRHSLRANEMRRAAPFIAMLCVWSGTALAVIPHEGNYTSKQMAGMVVGFLSSDEARRCGKTVGKADALVGRLINYYGFDKDDVEEDSPFGKRYVAKGRIIASQDARAATFCEDVDFEIQEDTVELLPH